MGCIKDALLMSDFCEQCLTKAVGMRNANAVPETSTKVGGDISSNSKLQLLEYIHNNGIPFIEGCVIRCVTNWRDKGSAKDLEEAKHLIDILIEIEGLK